MVHFNHVGMIVVTRRRIVRKQLEMGKSIFKGTYHLKEAACLLIQVSDTEKEAVAASEMGNTTCIMVTEKRTIAWSSSS